MAASIPGRPSAGQTSNDSSIGSYESRFPGKKCFVIMPYGKEKPEVEGAQSEREHFDSVYGIIAASLGELGIEVDRSDRNPHSAPIHRKMISDILDSDLAVVDISKLNPNVFYELGIRHTARPSGTILICEQGQKPPFNIAGVKVISYSVAPTELAATKSRLKEAAIANLGNRVIDSLVHSVIPGLNLARKPVAIKQREVEKYTLTVMRPAETVAIPARPPAQIPKPHVFTLGFITGDIIDVDLVDVWVNPESTRMEMARIHDNSVSAYIRYHGAKRDRLGNIDQDIVYDELSRCFRKRRQGSIVEAGTVIVTGPGELARPNRLRRIFHIAAQHGEPCNGYQTIRNYPVCVSNALEMMDNLNCNWTDVDPSWVPLRLRPLQSILFPLLGVRSREHEALEVAENLVRTAIAYLTHWPETKTREIYFLAYTERDRELCETAFTRVKASLEARARSHPPAAVTLSGPSRTICNTDMAEARSTGTGPAGA